MKRILTPIIMILLLFSSLAISTSETDQWWNDDFNFRLGVVPQNSADPGYFDIVLSDIAEDLGLYPLDPDWGYDENVDPGSLRLVEHGSTHALHDFLWYSNNISVVDDFESDAGSWNVSSQMESFVTEGADGDSLKFYKNTDSGVKMYTSVSAGSFEDMDYLAFEGKGSFMVSLRDPAKGKYIIEEELVLPEYRMVVLPLSFVNFREGVDYYLELIPLDPYTVNEVDNIRFIDDSIHIEFAPAANDLYLYFNTYLTDTPSEPMEMASFGGDAKSASVTAAEGFRINYVERPTKISGTYTIKASVSDNRHDIEWVRYRIDHPSWVELDSTEYGVWGDMELENGIWTADWDTIKTVSDGHHTLTILAQDVTGDLVFQMLNIEIDNIVGYDTDLAPGVEQYRFALVGDTQPESGSDDNPYAATYIMETLAKDEDIDFIIQVGDLNYAGHLYEYFQVREEITAFSEVPFYATVGNHDAATSDGLENFEYFYGDVMYSFHYGNSHFIFLCTELDNQKGYITGNQLTWLEEELSSNQDKDHIFIMAHQPLYPIFHGIENQEDVHAVIERYDNVTAIFQGHEHTYFHEVLEGGIHNFVTGGATWLDPQYPEENTFNHYFIIDVNGEEMEWRVEKISHFKVDEPSEGTYTSEASIDVVGQTQAYTDVEANGIAYTTGPRGDFQINVPLEYGENAITVSTSDLPDGEDHSISFTVFRTYPLEMDCPDTVDEGEPLTLKVLSQGAPVDGVVVQIIGQTKVTGQDGIVSFDQYPSDSFRISAQGEGYEGTYKTVEVGSGAGDSNDYTIAIVVLVFIVLGAAYSLLRRK